MLWLGGDLAENSSADTASIAHLDSIFDFRSPNTLWSLGNHDYKNTDLIRHFTSNEKYFYVKKNGITIVVLDTQHSQSNIAGDQLNTLKEAIDGMDGDTHLILLHHKLIWMYGDDELAKQIDSVSNAPAGDCDYCINPNNFYDQVYPLLLEVRQKGIEVICVGGDLGKKTSEFTYQTAEGIHFLASGINANEPDQKALLFYHSMATRELTWEYLLISDIYAVYPKR
jgi:hypothetical protein